MATRQETNRKREKLRSFLRQQSRQHSGEPTLVMPVRKLADMHELSAPVVCNVLQQLTAEGVLRMVPRVGTFVVAAPRARRHVIGVSHEFLVDRHEPYWTRLLQGISAGARRSGAETLLLSPGQGPIWERTSGILVSGVPMSDLSGAPSDFPHVSLITPIPHTLCVTADDYGGARSLTERLLALGHTRIALMYAGDRLFIDERVRGYQDALRAGGVDPNPAWIQVRDRFSGSSQTYIDHGYQQTQQWLATNWRRIGCTALMAYNDPMAVGAIRAFKDAGMTVPGDVSVAGFDGNPAFSFFEPQLTTVYVPLQEIGQLGAELLIRQINGEAITTAPAALPATLVPGKSCGPRT